MPEATTGGAVTTHAAPTTHQPSHAAATSNTQPTQPASGAQKGGGSQVGASPTQGDSKTVSDQSSNQSGSQTQAVTQRAGEIAKQAAEHVSQEGRTLNDKEKGTLVTQVINGQKVTKSLQEWINVAMKEQASAQRFQEASKLRQQAVSLIQLAQTNPKEFFKATGKDPYQFAQQTLAEQLEELGLSDTERENRQLKAWKEQKEREDAQAKQQAEIDAQTKREADEYNKMVKESLDAWKESGLPDRPYFGQRMAAEIAAHQAQGIPLTWKEAAAIVKQDWETSDKQTLDAMTSEQLASHLGEKNLKKIRDYELARIESKRDSKAPSSRPGKSPASPKKEQNFVNNQGYNDYWDRLGFRG